MSDPRWDSRTELDRELAESLYLAGPADSQLVDH